MTLKDLASFLIFVENDQNTSILTGVATGNGGQQASTPFYAHIIGTMQKLAHRTIEPRAHNPLIHEGFIRQANFVKAVQESQGD